jgi:hypothetical protein
VLLIVVIKLDINLLRKFNRIFRILQEETGEVDRRAKPTLDRLQHIAQLIQPGLAEDFLFGV